MSSKSTSHNPLSSTSTHIHQPTPIPALKITQLDPTFICTICWQPQYPPPGQSSSNPRFGPKLLGTSARIVCHACWCAVLDLSICWVCGECIVRGDDVVSLGWCFWHRGCFGCLMCSTKIKLTGDDDEITCQGEEGSGDGSKKRKRSAGVELEDIPLCATCEAETGGEQRDKLLKRGIETVAKVDGGLSRSRLERFSEQRPEQVELKLVPGRLARRPRRVKGATGIESELGRFINRSSTVSGNASESCLIEDRVPLLLLAPRSGISEDGSSDERIPDRDGRVIGEDVKSGLDQPTVYVSVFDPIGDPPFAPSPTKPLPNWMSLLPRNVQRARERDENRRKLFQDGGPNSRLSSELIFEPHSNNSNLSEESSSDSSGSREEPRSSYNPMPPVPRNSEIESESSTSPIDIPRPRRRAASSISFQSNDFIESLRASRRSQSINTHDTPPEFSTKRPQFRRHPTPFPRITRPTIERESSSSYFNQSVNTNARPSSSPDGVFGVMSPDEPQRTAVAKPEPDNYQITPDHSFSMISLESAASSEYLDRYQPEKPVSSHQRYVAKNVKPVMEKFQKKRSEMKSRSSEEGKCMIKIGIDGVQPLDDEREDFGVELKKKKDLNDELKNLFDELLR